VRESWREFRRVSVRTNNNVKRRAAVKCHEFVPLENAPRCAPYVGGCRTKRPSQISIATRAAKVREAQGWRDAFDSLAARLRFGGRAGVGWGWGPGVPRSVLRGET